MNQVILIGRLTKKPEVRYTTNGGTVVSYTLAVDRIGKGEDGKKQADFIRCVAFGRAAEFAEKYLQKGTKIAITGRIQTGSYTDQEGKKVYTTDVVVWEQEFVETKRQESGPAPSVGELKDRNGFMEIPDGLEEELPFS